MILSGRINGIIGVLARYNWILDSLTGFSGILKDFIGLRKGFSLTGRDFRGLRRGLSSGVSGITEFLAGF